MMEMTFTHKEYGSVTLEVPTWEEAHVNTKAYIWNYGLTQCLQDSYASAKNAGEFDGKLRKRYDKLIAGEMKIAAQRTVRSELEREMETIAEAKVKSAAAKKKVTLKKADLEKKVEEYIVRFSDDVQFNSNLTLRAEAERNIEERKANADEAEVPEDFFA